MKKTNLIALCVLWLAACSSGGMDERTQQATNAGPSSAIPSCTDRSSAVGIEGGGSRRVAGVISSIAGDGTLVVGCLRISGSSATVLIAGQPGTLSDLRAGDAVEVVGTVNPDSGVLQAASISTRGVSGELVDGRYIGTVTTGGRQLLGDAIVTVDGAVRLYVGGPYSPSGALL
ncbi:MAG: DUF5666 domain-containing protein, partial [Steroidobacterales bacterium]